MEHLKSTDFHVMMQFESDYVVDTALTMNEDLLNSKYKDKLELTYKVNFYVPQPQPH